MHGKIKTAIKLLSLLKENQLDPKELKTWQRQLCVRYFMDEQPQMSQEQIAHVLGINRCTVSRYMTKVVERDKRIVERMDPLSYSSHLVCATRARIKKLETVGNWYYAHKLEMDLCDKLMDLGMLERKARKIDLNGNIVLQEIFKLAADHGDEKEPFLGGNGHRLEGLN